MPISDVYTAHFTPTVAATTVTPAGSLISPATKRAWVVGVRVKILSTAAVAGFNTLFQLARPNATNTATGLSTVTDGHDFSAPASLSSFASTWSTPPTVGTAAGAILAEYNLPQTTGSMWEEFPPSGYEWQVPAIATGAVNSGVHLFVTQGVATSTTYSMDLIFSE